MMAAPPHGEAGGQRPASGPMARWRAAISSREACMNSTSSGSLAAGSWPSPPDPGRPRAGGGSPPRPLPHPLDPPGQLLPGETLLQLSLKPPRSAASCSMSRSRRLSSREPAASGRGSRCRPPVGPVPFRHGGPRRRRRSGAGRRVEDGPHEHGGQRLGEASPPAPPPGIEPGTALPRRAGRPIRPRRRRRGRRAGGEVDVEEDVEDLGVVGMFDEVADSAVLNAARSPSACARGPA